MKISEWIELNDFHSMSEEGNTIYICIADNENRIVVCKEPDDFKAMYNFDYLNKDIRKVNTVLEENGNACITIYTR